MFDLQWVHVGIGAASAAIGAAGGIFAGGWRLGQIEVRLKLHFKESITACEKRFEDKVDQATAAFDETLKGLRQKINDVELETVRDFVAKGDFDDFRKEYREDMRDLKHSIASIPRSRQ